MPLMDYFTSGGDPMAAVMKQIQGAMESFGSRGGTPPQPTQAPVNPQNAWSLFSGSTNPYTSTGPSEEYQQQRAAERAESKFGQGMYEASEGEAAAERRRMAEQITDRNRIRRDPGSRTGASAIQTFDSPYRGTGPIPDEPITSRVPVPEDEMMYPEQRVGSRHGIFEPPEHTQDITRILGLRAPRSFARDIQNRINEASDLRSVNWLEEQSGKLIKNPRTIGDWLHNYAVSTAPGRGGFHMDEPPIIARQEGPQNLYELLPPGLRPQTVEFDYTGDDPWMLEWIEKKLNEIDTKAYTEREGMKIWNALVPRLSGVTGEGGEPSRQRDWNPDRQGGWYRLKPEEGTLESTPLLQGRRSGL